MRARLKELFGSGEGFRCYTCGKWHDHVSFHWSSDRPAAWYDVPEEKRESDVLLSSDQCVIADRFFFVRANIEIPVLGAKEPFSWGVWVSVSKQNFDRYHDLWNSPGREKMIPPMFGWVNTDIAIYPQTLNLKTNVHVQPVGTRPLAELEPTDHPLSIEQRGGITIERVREIASKLMHH